MQNQKIKKKLLNDLGNKNVNKKLVEDAQDLHIMDQVNSLESLTRMIDASSKRRSILSREGTQNQTMFKVVSKQHVATGVEGEKQFSPFNQSKNISSKDNSLTDSQDGHFIREYVLKSPKHNQPHIPSTVDLTTKLDKVQQEYLQQILNNENLQFKTESSVVN